MGLISNYSDKSILFTLNTDNVSAIIFKQMQSTQCVYAFEINAIARWSNATYAAQKDYGYIVSNDGAFGTPVMSRLYSTGGGNYYLTYDITYATASIANIVVTGSNYSGATMTNATINLKFLGLDYSEEVNMRYSDSMHI